MIKEYKVRISSRYGDYISTVYEEACSYIDAMNQLRKSYPYEVLTLLDVNHCLVCE